MAAVPKFGEWDNGKDTTLYTARFDVARTERGSGGVGHGVGRGSGGVGHGVGRGSAGGSKPGIMNPNDPLENPDAFNFGNRGRGVKPSNMNHENQHHPPGCNNNNQSNDKINGTTRPPSSSPSPARHTASPAKAQNRVRPPSSTPPRASVNPSGITANRGRRALPTFGEWDDPSKEAEGYTAIFNNARGQPSMQFGKNPVKEFEDDGAKKHQHKKSSFCGLFRQRRRK